MLRTMKKLLISVCSALLGYELSALFFERSPLLYIVMICAVFFALLVISVRTKDKLIFFVFAFIGLASTSLLMTVSDPPGTFYAVRNDLALSIRQLEKLKECPESFDFVKKIRDQYDPTHFLNYRKEQQECLMWSYGPDGIDDSGALVFDPRKLAYSSRYLNDSNSFIKRYFAQDQLIKGDIVVECKIDEEANRALKCRFL